MDDFWKGKRVLVTGHTGFKGSWLSLWLRELGAEVLGLALEPRQELDNFRVSRLESRMNTVYQDIRDYVALEAIWKDFRPGIVFHLAAQSLVGKAHLQPRETFETNTLGTLNVLEAIRHSDTVRSAVLITSDKCYRNVEQIWGYRENDVLGGEDPYSASKGCAELVIHSYTKCYFGEGRTNIASTRAGNVIGGGDWSENRIVPDSFRALFAGDPVTIRNPGSTRPWQFVLDPLRGYLLLAEGLYKGVRTLSGSWNFGPSLEDRHTVADVADAIVGRWGEGRVVVKKEKSFPESALLQLDCARARSELGWRPLLSFEESIRMTTAWYRHLHDDRKSDMYDFCVRQVKEYERLSPPENRHM
jgi:CDP-glucose 4,6-dehydratase